MKIRQILSATLVLLCAVPVVIPSAQAAPPHERLEKFLFGDRDKDKDNDKDRKKKRDRDDDRDRDRDRGHDDHQRSYSYREHDHYDHNHDGNCDVCRVSYRPVVTSSVVIRRDPVVVYPEPTYRERDYDFRPVEVDVQLALRRLGYYRGRIDGDIGPGTRGAIRAYQYDNDLPVTGRIDRYLLRSLSL